ncbi:MAG: DUF1573 domain-containing protein [Bacteroidia bacterium]
MDRIFNTMKNIRPIAIFLAVFIIVAAFRTPGNSIISFKETKFNFGFIRQGEIVSHDFEFTNNGDAPLIISDAEVTCTCTTVDFPKKPLMKGEKGNVKVTFDSKSAIDRQERSVKVYSNGSAEPVILTFKCVVLKTKGE